MPRLAWLALASIGVVGAYLAVLFLVQRSVLFPIPTRPADRVDGRAEAIRAGSAGSEAHALFLAVPGATRTPLVMFMHGNGELAADWLQDFETVREWGVAVLLVEYPGYGGAPGSPSERSINGAVRAAFDWASADPRIDPARIIAYGRSLGGGPAARLAADRRVAALILESAFTSVADFAARMLAPSFLVRDRFDNRAALAAYRGPVLLIHGTHDTIVPIDHGRALAGVVPGVRFHEINCGHNDCPRQWNVIREFLRTSGIID